LEESRDLRILGHLAPRLIRLCNVCLTGNWQKRWKESSWKEEEGARGKWEHSAGDWFGHEHDDKGIRTTEDYRFYTLWSEFPEFTNKGKDLVLQVCALSHY
jgi:hypothetical protein